MDPAQWLPDSWLAALAQCHDWMTIHLLQPWGLSYPALAVVLPVLLLLALLLVASVHATFEWAIDTYTGHNRHQQENEALRVRKASPSELSQVLGVDNVQLRDSSSSSPSSSSSSSSSSAKVRTSPETRDAVRAAVQSLTDRLRDAADAPIAETAWLPAERLDRQRLLLSDFLRQAVEQHGAMLMELDMDPQWLEAWDGQPIALHDRKQVINRLCTDSGMELHTQLLSIAKQAMVALGLFLGARDSFSLFADRLGSELRLNLVRAAHLSRPHTLPSMMTVVMPGTTACHLQLYDTEQHLWHPVELNPGSALVLIGTPLYLLTQGFMPSATIRTQDDLILVHILPPKSFVFDALDDCFVIKQRLDKPLLPGPIGVTEVWKAIKPLTQ